MEPSTASQSPASEPTRTDTIQTSRSEKAYGDRNFKPTTVPGLVGSGPLLPEWLRKRFQRKDTPASH